ncbi:Cof-type HAD-IIB family hydrolase [Bacillus salipaludis]|uniref:Cof-type HAD-IIB family hydrolase n=1 Tax=Bacillus salipaludis TaxID=2547811 RepID=UPI002E1F19B0|nr:Cof-type HAD-IIB family hydrolase [Bacillus salipaludis]
MSLIAIDLDGTLLNHQLEISEENIKAIQFAQENGIEVVISTGRAYFDVRRICEKAGLSTVVIGTNGATIHSKDEMLMSAAAIEKNDIQSILQWLDEQDFYYEVFTNTAIYTIRKDRENFNHEIQMMKRAGLDGDRNELVEEAERQLDQYGYVFVENYHDILKQKEDVYNIVVCSFDEKKLEESRKHFKEFGSLTVVSSAHHNIEITSKHASKGIALEKLCSLTNCSLDHAMAIGDSDNDRSMFQKVKYSVAMGNAKREIKDICTMVTLKNNEDGVAHAIYRYFKNLVIQP